QRINFMVDTGASVVALNETSAARFGLRPVPGDYTSRVTTANGTIKAARARIAMVEIGEHHRARRRRTGAARQGAVGKPARPVL
ncbi:TIGR02281 family clan AA aspartic protease, partial [Serratia marcescens]|nr:TIGR02281 family clan AA aspartic protease [Serratia marcescens]